MPGLNLIQLRTWAYQIFTFAPPSGQKYFLKEPIFSIIRGLFGFVMPKNDCKCSKIGLKELLDWFWNKKSQKKFFDQKFSLFWPNFRGKGHFQRDATRDAQVSTGHGRYQIVRWPKAFNSSYNRDLRVGKLTSGGQFSAKNRKNYALKWRKFSQKFFSILVFKYI